MEKRRPLKIILIIILSIFTCCLIISGIDFIIPYVSTCPNLLPKTTCSIDYIPVLRRLIKFESSAAKKPALYFYPIQKEEINVKLNFEGEFFKYPTYDTENGWKFIAKSNGELLVNNRVYDYLFWEGVPKQSLKFDMTKGFVVKKDNVVNFLESKLTEFGLNDNEKNEFIIYWAPIMEENEYTLVHFATKSEYDDKFPISISPKPKEFNRLFIAIKSVPADYNVVEQTVSKFDRSGYNVFEWGGINLDKK